MNENGHSLGLIDSALINYEPNDRNNSVAAGLALRNAAATIIKSLKSTRASVAAESRSVSNAISDIHGAVRAGYPPPVDCAAPAIRAIVTAAAAAKVATSGGSGDTPGATTTYGASASSNASHAFLRAALIGASTSAYVDLTPPLPGGAPPRPPTVSTASLVALSPAEIAVRFTRPGSIATGPPELVVRATAPPNGPPTAAVVGPSGAPLVGPNVVMALASASIIVLRTAPQRPHGAEAHTVSGVMLRRILSAIWPTAS